MLFYMKQSHLKAQQRISLSLNILYLFYYVYTTKTKHFSFHRCTILSTVHKYADIY